MTAEHLVVWRWVVGCRSTIKRLLADDATRRWNDLSLINRKIGLVYLRIGPEDGMAKLTDQIEERLKTLGIEYRLLHHEPVTTSADAARVRGVALSSGAKALLVKANESFSLFVVPADRQLDWRSVKAVVGSKSARFATEEELLERTGLAKGSVPPFGNLMGIPVYVDDALIEEELVRFNAGSLTDSVEMPGSKLLDAVEGEWGSFSKSGS